MSSVRVFANHLDEKNYIYKNKEGLLEVTMLSETNLIELLNFINNERLNIASINIAVKKRLRDGIKMGYHNFWNKIYRYGLPSRLNIKLIARNIDPTIKI